MLWRPATRDVEVAIVHRPRYDGWSLPKGKLAEGEHPVAGAWREVVEETGIRPLVGPRLPTRRYGTSNGPKVVEYWAMRPGDGSFVATAEVDQLRWHSRADAQRRLSYPLDGEVLEALDTATTVDALVLLVRHASAGDPDQWSGDDRLRPLDTSGHRQTEVLRRILPVFGPTRLLSVDSVRCMDTIAPLAADLGLDVQPEQALEEHHYEHQPATGRGRIRQLARDGGVPVACSQGTVIRDVIATLANEDGLTVPEVAAKKGSVWALFFCRGRLAAADYYPCLTSSDIGVE